MNSQEFFNLFGLKDEEYIKNYIWNDTNREIGFSIVKHYPKRKFFKPAVTQNDSIDTVSLIKVYTFPKSETDSWRVGTSISKASLFQLDKPFNPLLENSFSDPDSPTQESLEQSSKGLQPINLEENDRFLFNAKDKTFFDTKKNIKIQGRFIVDNIYNEHVNTFLSFRGSVLKLRLAINRISLKLLEFIGNFLIAIIPKVAGKKIENKAYNMFIEPFHFVNPAGKDDRISNEGLMPYDDLVKKINPFMFSWMTFFILLIYILYSAFCIDFLHIVSFIKANKDDEVFSITLIVFIMLFFNYILPNFLLWTLNQFIKLSRKWSFKFFKL